MNESTNSSVSTDLKQKAIALLPRLKGKQISALTVPLLVMATITEFVILAIGWKYQQIACLPQGMGVTFFGIGPIGATILAVELLKLPLAIWTASRHGYTKAFMLCIGLPLICVLTFQLVKDMAVYEMGVAMTPAAQMLEKAVAEDTKIAQLNGELAGIEQKKTERERKLAEIGDKRTKARANVEEALKRNDEARQDAINLTDYQKKELSEVEARQANIIAQFNADTAQVNKDVADLRARREVEVGRASKWNTEEARIENEYKAKKADYDNKKAAYDKARAEYEGANFIKRQLMREPVSPGVPPERETNPVLKPTAVAEIDAQIKAKQDELLGVNNKRRDRVAQVEADARRLREEYDKRSSTRREKTDSKREELTAGQTTVLAQLDAEEKAVDQEVAGAVKKVDGIRAQIDACRKTADGYYEARETAIRKTQVHRIATTVEIVRGLLKGERPQSIKAGAKERGDVLTDQISMVRIWVYPVLAFIVAFLPTLMVEIGFSTIFQPEQQRPQHRLGFLGRRMHWLYTRAGRLQIARHERIANEASAQIAARESKVVAATRALAAKEAELQAASEAHSASEAAHQEALIAKEQQQAEQWKSREADWVAKLAGMADSLNRAIVEKDALRDLQRSEVERQVQSRQNAWSERVTQMRQELDDQRAAGEAERVTLMQEHHRKLMELTEDCKNQVMQARRQTADAELAAVEQSARLTHELKEAQQARDEVQAQLKQHSDATSLRLAQAQEESSRQVEKFSRQEKHRFERQQFEFEKTLRDREQDFEHRMKQREQEMSLGFEARLEEEKKRLEQREQELAVKAEARETELQKQWGAQLRVREEEWERQAEARARAGETRLAYDAQQKEELFGSKLRQRDQQWQTKLDSARAELQGQTKELLRRREAESLATLRDLEAQLRKEMQEKEQAFQAQTRQREQELVTQVSAQAEARYLAAQAQWDAESERKALAALEPYKVLLARAERERDDAKLAASQNARHVQALEEKLNEASSFLSSWRTGKQPDSAVSWSLEKKDGNGGR
jgi:hypothetical protein